MTPKSAERLLCDGIHPHLKHGLCCVALDVISVDDDLDDAVPHLLADVVSGDADEVENGVHVPGIIHGVFLRQDRHLKHLRETKRAAEGGRRTERGAQWWSGPSW